MPARPRGNPVTRLIGAVGSAWSQGSDKLTNLNAYALGLSAVFTGVGSGIIPLLVTSLTDQGRVHFLWMDLDKNGAIATISLCGLLLAALVQPIAGSLSDRTRTAFGKRTSFMALGAVGLAFATMSLGFADGFLPMLAAVAGIQAFGNFLQGPANALLIDHVPPSRIGAAAGALNAFKIIGAGVFVVAVLLLMDNYDRDTGRIWLWLSLLLVTGAMLCSAAWTISSLRAGRGRRLQAQSMPPKSVDTRSPSPIQGPPPRRRAYLGFLVSLVFVIAAMSAMGVYAIPFLEDAVGLDDPAKGAAALAVVLALSTAVVAVPAGKLHGRFGHRWLLLAGGASGATGALLLMGASTLLHVMLIGLLIGVAIGIFVSVTWAMANGLVPKTKAARDLGYTSLATLVGAALARLAGPGIDALNTRSADLGYQWMLGGIALAFIITPLMLGLVGDVRWPAKKAGTGPAI